MPDILAARAQMGMSLAFHIIFACVGVAMPLLMAIAEWRYLRTGDEVYYTLPDDGLSVRQLCSPLARCSAPCFPSSLGFCGHSL
jgi:hypothetical protein